MTSSLNLVLRRCSIEPRARKHVKEKGFLSFLSFLTIIGYRLDSVKTAST